jgi:hypothetical protein
VKKPIRKKAPRGTYNGGPIATIHGPMIRDTLVTLSPYLESRELDRVVGEFGWRRIAAGSLLDLRAISRNRNVVAVLFESEPLGVSPLGSVRAIRKAAPQALPILCYRPSEPIRWTELADAGAFHALLLPLDTGELRQSLAFVHDAERRRCRRLARSAASYWRPLTAAAGAA